MTHSFDSLGLMPELLHAVRDAGYKEPTPVQIKAIPPILAGRDILAAAQTGTGKTAGFALPILQMISQSEKRAPSSRPLALVLAPTRELAAQIEESFRLFAKYTHTPTAVVFGGVGVQPQISAIARGIDVLVATPGRLLDLIGQKAVFLDDVRYFVLDEADRMLDMGFIHDIRRVLALLPSKRQSLLFSATFSSDIKALAGTFLKDPAQVEISHNQEAALVTQEFLSIAKARRRELLRDLIVDGQWEQVLVFTRMKHTANRLAQQLIKDGIDAAAIHGNKSQGARTKALSGFKAHEVRVLVATDIAARGLDIEQLPHVVNFELPNVPEDYVHRIGRTGRAGLPGHAVSFVTPDDMDNYRAIAKLLKRDLGVRPAQGYDGPAPDDIAADDAKQDRIEQRQRQREKERRQEASPKPARPARSKPAPQAAGSAPAPARPARSRRAEPAEKAARKAPSQARVQEPARSKGRPAASRKAARPAAEHPRGTASGAPARGRHSAGHSAEDSRVRGDVFAVRSTEGSRREVSGVRSNLPPGMLSRLIRRR